jgi:hypothetical protein
LQIGIADPDAKITLKPSFANADANYMIQVHDNAHLIIGLLMLVLYCVL